MVDRQNALKEWLNTLIKHNDFTLNSLAADASFRHYFRLQYDGLSQVVMDAPPDKETLSPFIHVARLFEEADIKVPHIAAINQPLGFLLLSDLGDRLLLGELDSNNVDYYYKEAMSILFKLQQYDSKTVNLPYFDKAFMLKEMELCSTWFFESYLGLELTEAEKSLILQTFERIATEVATQPLVCIHRDYHSRNLMLQEDNAIAVIDFQDAMLGPITYDLVSLLKDCYVSWPREKVLEWVGFFHKKSPKAQQYCFNDFVRAFDLCGLQRHIKVLGVFSRLSIRDNKPRYLQDLPLTLNYVLECAKNYPELHPFLDFLQSRVSLP